MPKKAAKEAPSPFDALPRWDDANLADVYSSAPAAAEEQLARLPASLAGRVSEWLRPAEFSAAAEGAKPAVLHVDLWPPPPPPEPTEGEEVVEEGEEAAEAAEEETPPPEPVVPSAAEEYSRTLKCAWQEDWTLRPHGLGVPVCAPLPAEPTEDGGEDVTGEVEPLGPDPVLSRVAECFLAVLNGSVDVREPDGSFATMDGSTRVPDGSCLWEAVYPKDERGWPTVSESGVYAVKIWWDGAWRCVAVDDSVPVDAEGRSLLLHSVHVHELWPMLITKALLVVAQSRKASPDTLADCATILHQLSGWCIEKVPIADVDLSALVDNPKQWAVALQEAPLMDGEGDEATAAVPGPENGLMSDGPARRGGVLCTVKVKDTIVLDGTPHAFVKVPQLCPPALLKAPPEPEPKCDEEAEAEPAAGEEAEAEPEAGEEPEAAAEEEPPLEPEPEPLQPTLEKRPIPFAKLDAGFGMVYICRPVAEIEHHHTVTKEPRVNTELGECFCVDAADSDSCQLVLQLTASLASLPDPAEGEEPPSVEPYWCKVQVDTYDWAQPSRRRRSVLLSTHGVTAGTISVPAGRQCYKLKIDSACPCHVELISAAPISYGEEQVVLQEQLEVTTTITEGASVRDGTQQCKIPLMLFGHLTVDGESQVCLDLTSADAAKLPSTRYVITNHDATEQGDGAEAEYFCQRTAAIALAGGGSSLAVLMAESEEVVAWTWQLRMLSAGAAPALALLPPKYNENVSQPYSPVRYYPAQVLFRKNIEVVKFEAKTDGIAYVTLRVQVPGLQSGMVKLEVFNEDTEEAEPVLVRQVQGRQSAFLSSMVISANGPLTFLLQGSVTDAGAIDSETTHWELDVFSTEKEMKISDDTKKSDGYEAIRQEWEAEEKGRAEKAETARAAYLASIDPESSAEATEVEDDEAAALRREKELIEASVPTVKTGSTPTLLSPEVLGVMAAERADAVAKKAERLAALAAERENAKIIRESEQQAMDAQLDNYRGIILEQSESAVATRAEYREVRVAQKQRQQQIITAAAALCVAIRGVEEEPPEPAGLEALLAVLLAGGVAEDTAGALIALLSEKTPPADAEAFAAALAEHGLAESMVRGLIELPEAEVLPAEAALGLTYLGRQFVRTPWESGSAEEYLFPVADFSADFEAACAVALAAAEEAARETAEAEAEAEATGKPVKAKGKKKK